MHAELPRGLESVARSCAEAESLDERRRKAQMDIFGLVEKYADLCAGCGRCCQERVDRYTIFDRFIHEPLSRRLESCGGQIYDPIWMLTSGIKRTLNRYYGLGDQPPPCRYLSPGGCSIEKEMRPMLCTSWFCPKYIRKFTPEDIDKLEAPLSEIEAIHREIFLNLKGSKITAK